MQFGPATLILLRPRKSFSQAPRLWDSGSGPSPIAAE